MSRFSIFRDFTLIAIIVAAMLLYHGYHRDLPEAGTAEFKSHDSLPSASNRRVEHVILNVPSLGDIGLAVNLPQPLPEGKRLPVVMVLGGLDTGEHNISPIGEAGDNVIVGYDWPMPIVAPNDPTFIIHTPEFYKRALVAPAQIASAIDWLAHQPWADEERISLLGYSMGAIAAPAAQEEAQNMGHIIRWTILAYGGAPLEDMVDSDEHIKPSWMRHALAPLVKVLFHPLEPDEHLQHLSGNFLILEGKDDSLIPEAARARLRDAAPQPKTVVTFEGDHMGIGADKNELLHKIIDASKQWLISTNAVNPL